MRNKQFWQVAAEGGSISAPISVTGVSLDLSAVAITEALTQQLTQTVTPVDAANQNVTWSSDDLAIATVDANGLVTAVSEGVAMVTVTTVDGSYSASSTITVQAAAVTDYSLPTPTASLDATQNGYMQWNWGDVALSPIRNGTSLGGHLKNNQECNALQVTNNGDGRLRFHLDPLNPVAQSWCNNSYNLRAEVSHQPALNNLAKGTEQWLGFSYWFGDDYLPDSASKWLFLQNFDKDPASFDGPVFSIRMNSSNALGAPGEIRIVRNVTASATQAVYFYTGVVPLAGERHDFVVNIKWDDDANGYVNVWDNNVLIYSFTGRTAKSTTDQGGHWKWGIYKTDWRNLSKIQESAALGITSLTTYLGPVKQITLAPTDPDNGVVNHFATVDPNP